MTENIVGQINSDNAEFAVSEESKRLNEANEAFMAYVGSLEGYSELDENSEGIKSAGQELIRDFNIAPSLFEKKDEALIFTSLASLSADILKTGERGVEIDRMREFIADAAFLLTMDDYTKGGELDELRAQQESLQGESEDSKTQLKVLNKFTDPTITQRLTRLVESQGLFHEVNEKLGLSEQDANPVEIHVLSIGKDHDSVNFDHKANGLDWSEANDWAVGLKKRADQFVREFPNQSAELAASASGFAMQLDGQQHIFLPFAEANVLLANEDDVLINETTARPHGIVGTLKHEYTHAQKNVRRGRFFGWSIEERRAEYISGDSGEYYDVKGFFNNLAVLTGEHVNSIFNTVGEERRVDTDDQTYGKLAKAYGLSNLVKIAAVMPDPYIPHLKGPIEPDMQVALGGYRSIVFDVAAGLDPQEKEEAKVRLEEKISHFEERGLNVEVLLEVLAPAIQALDYDTAKK
jgi:hypothetical protein